MGIPGELHHKATKIGIDLGAGHGGPPSALELPGLRLFKAYPDGRVSFHPLLTPEQLQR